jgi:hypothetical protein
VVLLENCVISVDAGVTTLFDGAVVDEDCDTVVLEEAASVGVA